MYNICNLPDADDLCRNPPLAHSKGAAKLYKVCHSRGRPGNHSPEVLILGFGRLELFCCF